MTAEVKAKKSVLSKLTTETEFFSINLSAVKQFIKLYKKTNFTWCINIVIEKYSAE